MVTLQIRDRGSSVIWKSIIMAAVAAMLATGVAKADQRVGSFILIPSLPGRDPCSTAEITRPGTVNDFHRVLAERPRRQGVAQCLHSGGRLTSIRRWPSPPEIRQARHGDRHPPWLHVLLPACSYLFFAGREHVLTGKLGVHALSEQGVATKGPVYDADVRAALTKYGASAAAVLKVMASTPATDIHVFSSTEIASWSINRDKTGVCSKLARKWTSPTFNNRPLCGLKKGGHGAALLFVCRLAQCQ